MADVRVSGLAERDLAEIAEEGAQAFGIDAAAAHLNGVLRLFELLASHPGAGRPRPELGPGMRSIPHRPHRILYQVAEGKILIVRIVHAARDDRRSMRERG